MVFLKVTEKGCEFVCLYGRRERERATKGETK
jgi:hypothetical protein